MKKNSPLIKVLLVSVIVAVLGYVGLDVPREYIEEAIDEQFGGAAEEPATLPTDNEFYEVVSVIDGDTFKVLRDGEVYTVRLIGIDTPETKYSERGEECFGEEATRKAVELLEDKKVILESDSSQDKTDQYGRLLAYATLEDGRDFGEVMIRDGFAEEYKYADYYQKQQSYKEAEDFAKNAGVGLWGCE